MSAIAAFWVVVNAMFRMGGPKPLTAWACSGNQRPRIENGLMSLMLYRRAVRTQLQGCAIERWAATEDMKLSPADDDVVNLESILAATNLVLSRNDGPRSVCNLVSVMPYWCIPIVSATKAATANCTAKMQGAAASVCHVRLSRVTAQYPVHLSMSSVHQKHQIIVLYYIVVSSSSP
jgi:hypothetical protein